MIAVFTAVFFIFGLGFAVQRLRPLDDRTLVQLSGLVVEILLPFYLFFTIATSTTPESFSIAPALIAMGIVVPLGHYALATLALKPAGVAAAQRPAFRFSIMVANTAFLGIPICEALFGPIGAVYAVLFDFGTTLVAMTLGVWELNGGRFAHWRPLVFNPLIWGVVAGLGWSVGGWPFPAWLSSPLSMLGGATLPLALLVGGAQIGNIRAVGGMWRRQLFGLLTTRLIIAPLVVGSILAVFGGNDLFTKLIILQAAMPVGLTSTIFAKNYGADARFAASATLWSTLAAVISLPLIAIVLI